MLLKGFHRLLSSHLGANLHLPWSPAHWASTMATHSHQEANASSGSSTLENKVARMADPNSGKCCHWRSWGMDDNFVAI